MTARLPLVSVLIPAHNHAAFIEACLESVAASDYPRIELLILDDCSQDETYERANHWVSRHTHTFEHVALTKHRTNEGTSRTLNQLVASAAGDMLVPLASDDVLLPAGVSDRVRALTDEPQLLAVMGDCVVINTAGELLMSSAFRQLHGARLDLLLSRRHILRELLLNWSAPGPALMVRRAAFDQRLGVGPYDESCRVEDRDLYLRLLARHQIAFLPAPVAAYRLHDSNTVARPVDRARLLREVAAAERRCTPLFSGMNSHLLRLVAARGDAAATVLADGGSWTRVRYLLLRLACRAALAGHRVTGAWGHRTESSEKVHSSG